MFPSNGWLNPTAGIAYSIHNVDDAKLPRRLKRSTTESLTHLSDIISSPLAGPSVSEPPLVSRCLGSPGASLSCGP